MSSPNYILSSLLGGCAECAGMKKKDNAAYDAALKAKHGGWIIRVGDYQGGHVCIDHKCGAGHEWCPDPASVLHGQGCPGCAQYGFKPDKPAFLYYLRVIEKATEVHYFKIGIANRSVNGRVRQLLCEAVIIDVQSFREFDTGAEAYAIEQRILKEFATYLVPNCTLLKSGNSEIFNRDISEHLTLFTI